MAHIDKAVGMVIEYIITNGLYNFQSLAEETQAKLISAYGKGFEKKVNAGLPL